MSKSSKWIVITVGCLVGVFLISMLSSIFSSNNSNINKMSEKEYFETVFIPITDVIDDVFQRSWKINYENIADNKYSKNSDIIAGFAKVTEDYQMLINSIESMDSKKFSKDHVQFVVKYKEYLNSAIKNRLDSMSKMKEMLDEDEFISYQQPELSKNMNNARHDFMSAQVIKADLYAKVKDSQK